MEHYERQTRGAQAQQGLHRLIIMCMSCDILHQLSSNMCQHHYEYDAKLGCQGYKCGPPLCVCSSLFIPRPISRATTRQSPTRRITDHVVWIPRRNVPHFRSICAAPRCLRSAPIWDHVAFLKVQIASNSGRTISFGNWGYCILQSGK